MQQFLSVWFALDGRKRMIAAVSAFAMFAAIIGLSRMATSPSMALLYSGLDAGSAGQVVKALEQQGVAFEIRNNAIMVDSSRRDQLRMTLASDGLPANNGQGYEILDSLSGFGTTAKMFDAAYWRAKEGELARTIVSSPQFRSARVHIANAVSVPFQRAINPTASVTVTDTTGAVTGAHAKALKYLISSAIAGMTPSDVSVIDGRNGVVVAGDDASVGASGDNLAAELKANVERLLQARVGLGKAIVEVNVETTTENETITERTLDPNSRVAVSSKKEERTKSANGSNSGSVTVASNLPTGAGNGSNNNSSSQNNETTETTNYDFSQTTRELSRTPGSIKRISVAVLVDGVMATDPNTNAQTWQARDPAELASLRELVASAVGFNADRGDEITLKSMQFDTIAPDGVVVQASFLQNLNLDLMRLVQLATLALVSLVLGLFVLRPILSTVPTTPAIAPPRNVAGIPDLSPSPGSAPSQPSALTGEIDDRDILPSNFPAVQSDSNRANATFANTPPPEDPVERLRAMISDRQDETVEILRTWMDDTEEHA